MSNKSIPIERHSLRYNAGMIDVVHTYLVGGKSRYSVAIELTTCHTMTRDNNIQSKLILKRISFSLCPCLIHWLLAQAYA